MVMVAVTSLLMYGVASAAENVISVGREFAIGKLLPRSGGKVCHSSVNSSDHAEDEALILAFFFAWSRPMSNGRDSSRPSKRGHKPISSSYLVDTHASPAPSDLFRFPDFLTMGLRLRLLLQLRLRFLQHIVLMMGFQNSAEFDIVAGYGTIDGFGSVVVGFAVVVMASEKLGNCYITIVVVAAIRLCIFGLPLGSMWDRRLGCNLVAEGIHQTYFVFATTTPRDFGLIFWMNVSAFCKEDDIYILVGYPRDAPATVLFGEWFRFRKPSDQKFLFEKTYPHNVALTTYFRLMVSSPKTRQKDSFVCFCFSKSYNK
ncbi:hypothetical protein LXL04_029780 [Taraxacum kok-saghyz]